LSFKEIFLNRRPEAFGGIEWSRDKTKVSVIGIPFDSTVSYKPGTRFAPDHIRIASRNIELYSIRNQIDVEEHGIYDEGDIAVVHGDVYQTLDRVEKIVREFSSEDRFFIYVGGEHTITQGIIKGLMRKDLGVLVFDAHLDFRDEYLGLRYSHASVMRRVSELLGGGALFYIGVRAFSREELKEISKAGHEYITTVSLRRIGLREVIKRVLRWSDRYKHIYISLDIDVIDPSMAPGVGTPEPDGLTSWELFDLLNEVIDERVVSMDLVEVNPLNDPSEITSTLAAKIIVEATAKYLSLRKERS
jgi:agmatinase